MTKMHRKIFYIFVIAYSLMLTAFPQVYKTDLPILVRSYSPYMDSLISLIEEYGGGSFSGDMDDIPDGTTYVKTENNYNDAAVTKLSGIAAGAEVNVNADWSSGSGDSQILNKPTILTLGETSADAYRGDRGKTAYDYSQLNHLQRAGGFMNGNLVLSYLPITSDGTVNLGDTHQNIVLFTNGTVSENITVEMDGAFVAEGVEICFIALDIDATYDIILNTSATPIEIPAGTTVSSITLTDADNGKVIRFIATTTGNGSVWKQIYPDVAFDTKQNILVSGTNIKTIFGQAIPGSGALTTPTTISGYGISDTKTNFNSGVSDGDFLFVGDVTQYTDELAQDAIGAMADANTLTYTDGTPLLEVKNQMSITDDASGIKLSGDQTSPGNSMLYGTNGSGTKGWYAQPGGAPTGVLDDLQISILQGDGNLAEASGVQTWAGSDRTTQDVFTVTANTTYIVEGRFYINTGATTHTTAMAWSTGATITDFQYQVMLWSAAANTITTTQSTTHVSGVASKVLNATSTAVYTIIQFKGTIVVGSVAGGSTITPQINFSANPTGTCLMKRGSWISFTKIGTDTAIEVGGWE